VKWLKILGPPGTGKTAELLNLLEKELSEGILPERIAFLTFTRAARIEALQRAQKTEKEFPYLKTIHSICYHQLAIGRDQIARPENIRSFGKKIGLRLTGSDFDPWIEEFERGIDAPTKDDILIQANHHGRHRKIFLKEALAEVSTEVDYHYAVWLTKAYRAWKDAEGILDYTDLLSKYVEYGKPLDIDVMFIDEAQDLSKLQWDVVRILGANAKRGYVCGDDDQAIFNWAGADSSVFQDFQADEVKVLNQSYRVSKAVHLAASAITARISRRLIKSYSPTESEGIVSNAGYLGTVDLKQKTFILFRNHYRGAEISQILKQERIPYIGKGSPLNELDIRVALLAWHTLFKKKEELSEHLKRMVRYCDPDYLQPDIHNRIKNQKVVEIGDIFLDIPNPSKWYKILHKLPARDYLLDHVEHAGLLRTAMPKVELMSIHQSKGREAHTVVIDPEMSRAVFSGMIRNPDDEHRVWYVGITRAKERVFFLLPDGNFSYQF